jgi:hypothetical protein
LWRHASLRQADIICTNFAADYGYNDGVGLTVADDGMAIDFIIPSVLATSWSGF